MKENFDTYICKLGRFLTFMSLIENFKIFYIQGKVVKKRKGQSFDKTS